MTEIVLAPGSGKPLTRSLLDKNGQPIDFTTGTWRADLFIVEYPDRDALVFELLSTTSHDGSLVWLSFVGSAVVITPDPVITKEWDFHKYHYELYVQGPNVGSKPERVDHGSFRLDR